MLSLMHILYIKQQPLFLSTPILSFSVFQGTAFQQIYQPNFLSVPMYSLDIGGYSQGLRNMPVLGNMYIWWRSSLCCIHSGSLLTLSLLGPNIILNKSLFKHLWGMVIKFVSGVRACKPGLSYIYSIHMCHVWLGILKQNLKKENGWGCLTIWSF
jgi:hypothetical protein